MLATDGVFGADEDGTAVSYPTCDLDSADVLAAHMKLGQRGLRWLQRHGHLDSAAVHTFDAADHAGGWSVDVLGTTPGWDRQGLEKLVRYCCRFRKPSTLIFKG